MQDLTLKIPTLKFEVKEADYVTPNSDKPKRISQVVVFNGYESVGVISIERRYVRGSSEIEDVFTVNSKNINVTRGSSNKKSSKHIKVALRLAVDKFQRTPKDKLAVSIIKDMEDSIDRLVSNVKDKVEHVVRYDHTDLICEYLIDVAVNGAKPLSGAMEHKVGKKLKDLSDSMRIVKSVSNEFLNGNGAVAKIAPDGTIVVADLQTKTITHEAKDTYELPVNYQEKITMLKIVENSQPIENIGVKIADSPHRSEHGIYQGREAPDSHCFFMVGGDTVTTC
jgi:hypothetical protein